MIKQPMITERDIEAVEFIDKFRAVTADTLTKFIFGNIKVARRRLKYLTDLKLIKRVQLKDGRYAYYTKKIEHFKHSLAISEFYRELTDKFEVLHFEYQPDYGSIIPDASFIFVEQGKQKIGMLEVELSNNGLNTKKYVDFFSDDKYKKYISAKPSVIYVVGKKSIKPVEGLNFVIWGDFTSKSTPKKRL